MLTFTVRRLLYGVLLLFVIVTVAYLLLYAAQAMSAGRFSGRPRPRRPSRSRISSWASTARCSPGTFPGSGTP